MAFKSYDKQVDAKSASLDTIFNEVKNHSGRALFCNVPQRADGI
jgi:hypothetical protein